MRVRILVPLLKKNIDAIEGVILSRSGFKLVGLSIQKRIIALVSDQKGIWFGRGFVQFGRIESVILDYVWSHFGSMRGKRRESF
jgi:hypothetical protein